MPNIGSLPSAKALLRLAPRPVGRYGDHCRFEIDKPAGTVALIDDATGKTLAAASGAESVVSLGDVSTQTIPYVNAFITDHGKRVEKYWRTKEYRLVGDGPVGVTRTLSFVSPIEIEAEAETEAEAEAAPEPEPLSVVPVVETSDIPGLERPTKVKVKSAGKGWSAVGDIVVPDADLATLRDAWQLRQAGVPASVLITGPAGTAKTALVRAFAASIGAPFLKVDGGAIRTADDWAGAFRQDPNTKTWAHRWSPFARVLQQAEPAIVLIDEFNRTESPQAANALMGLLDWTGRLLVPDANATLHLPAGVLVVATANIGPEFVGTLPLDGAVRQRFPYGIRLGYPDVKREAKLLVDMTGIDAEIADRLVMLADSQRMNREDPQQYPSGSVISTRVLLDIARRIQTCATPPRQAVEATLRGQFDPGDEVALSVLVDAQFPAPIEEEEISEEEALAPLPAETPDPLGVAAAAGSPSPLITTGKHYFVNRYRSGGISTRCQYEFKGAGGTVVSICSAPASDDIHF